MKFSGVAFAHALIFCSCYLHVAALKLGTADVRQEGGTVLDRSAHSCPKWDSPEFQDIVKEIHGFFQRREGFWVHPLHLTMVNALRYGSSVVKYPHHVKSVGGNGRWTSAGGNGKKLLNGDAPSPTTITFDNDTAADWKDLFDSVVAAHEAAAAETRPELFRVNQPFPIDADMDFRVVKDNAKMPADKFKSMISALGDHLQRLGLGHKVYTYKNAGSFQLWMLMKEENPIGLKYANEVLPRTIKDGLPHRFPGIAKKVGNGVGDKSSRLYKHTLILDFFNNHDVALKQDPTRHVLFEKTVFPFPTNGTDNLAYDLAERISEMAHGDETAHKHIKKFCDLAMPQALFPDDVVGTSETKAISSECSKELADEGFFSFSELCK